MFWNNYLCFVNLKHQEVKLGNKNVTREIFEVSSYYEFNTKISKLKNLYNYSVFQIQPWLKKNLQSMKDHPPAYPHRRRAAAQAPGYPCCPAPCVVRCAGEQWPCPAVVLPVKLAEAVLSREWRLAGPAGSARGQTSAWRMIWATLSSLERLAAGSKIMRLWRVSMWRSWRSLERKEK